MEKIGSKMQKSRKQGPNAATGHQPTNPPHHHQEISCLYWAFNLGSGFRHTSAFRASCFRHERRHGAAAAEDPGSHRHAAMPPPPPKQAPTRMASGDPSLSSPGLPAPRTVNPPGARRQAAKPCGRAVTTGGGSDMMRPCRAASVAGQ